MPTHLLPLFSSPFLYALISGCANPPVKSGTLLPIWPSMTPAERDGRVEKKMRGVVGVGVGVQIEREECQLGGEVVQMSYMRKSVFLKKNSLLCILFEKDHSGQSG